MSKKKASMKTSMKRSTLGLVIVCVVLVAALGGFAAYSTITINTLTNKLNSLGSFIGTLTEGSYNSSSNVNSEIADLNETFNTLMGTLSSEYDAVASLNAILNLDNSTVWVNNSTVNEPAGTVWYNWTFSASYAGYVTIDVTSASPGALAQTEYSAYGVSYSNQTSVGTSGTASFPILPCSNITVGVGNPNPSGEATETVTITYYY